MPANDITFRELARAKVQDKRCIIISKCNKGGYTIGMQIQVEEKQLGSSENKITGVFMKGAHQISDINGLYELRNALNIAIQKEEETQWDEQNDTDELWDRT